MVVAGGALGEVGPLLEALAVGEATQGRAHRAAHEGRRDRASALDDVRSQIEELQGMRRGSVVLAAGAAVTARRTSVIVAHRLTTAENADEVIVFDTEPERIVRMQSARNRVRIENELRRIRPGGGTAIFPAMDAAAQDLALTRAVYLAYAERGDAPADQGRRAQALVRRPRRV